MSDNQDALRLADALERDYHDETLAPRMAAAELRRLHSLNTELVEALRWYVDTDEVMEMEGNEFWLDGRERARAALKDYLNDKG